MRYNAADKLKNQLADKEYHARECKHAKGEQQIPNIEWLTALYIVPDVDPDNQQQPKRKKDEKSLCPAPLRFNKI
jgi:hypothetical protein